MNSPAVLVTGAARGIGAATARELAARGARLALVGLEPGRLAGLAGELGTGHVWFAADVTDQSALDAAVAGSVERLGRLDAVLANAGVVNHGSVLVAPPAEFAHTVAVNLTGAYRTAAAVVPHLVRSRGYLLFVASVAAFAPLTGAAAYAASKAGVDSLAGTLRLELAAHGVAVGCAYPGWIDTDMVRDSEALLPSLRGARASLPWPLRSVAPVQTCAVALADAVERRARRVYVPRAAVLARVLGPVLASATTQRALRGRIRALLTQLDEEAASAAPAGVTR